MAKSAVIAPLTGIRLVAAVWVVCFHIYLYNGSQLAADHPWVDAVVGPIASQGDLGVDLFFLLSGFVLAHNYLERLGAEPSLSGSLSFLWLRVARIWPLYMIAICGGGLLQLVEDVRARDDGRAHGCSVPARGPVTSTTWPHACTSTGNTFRAGSRTGA